MAEAETEPVERDEDYEVELHRYQEALDAGLTPWDAEVFAKSDQDVSVLRKCVKAGFTPEQIAAIVA